MAYTYKDYGCYLWMGWIMTDWRTELLDTAMQAKDVDSLLNEILVVTRWLGFEYVAYGSQRRFPVSRQRLFIINNYSDNWKATYASNQYLNIDPYVAKCLKSSQPLVWDSHLKTCNPGFWEDAAAHGLNEGWGLSLLSCDAQGLVTFARSGEPVSVTELKAKQAELCWLSHITHLSMCRLQQLEDDRAVPVNIELSLREKEILRWTADGKSSAEISMILGISTRTVNFHIDHCLVKLNCQNKIAAVVKAMLLGLLWSKQLSNC
jgi:LuxR family quorum-sensing system transcriptional regulator SolR